MTIPLKIFHGSITHSTNRPTGSFLISLMGKSTIFNGKITMFNGKTHYKYMAIFNSYIMLYMLNYQRVFWNCSPVPNSDRTVDRRPDCEGCSAAAREPSSDWTHLQTSVLLIPCPNKRNSRNLSWGKKKASHPKKTEKHKHQTSTLTLKVSISMIYMWAVVKTHCLC